jgi:hypothetical protein
VAVASAAKAGEAKEREWATCQRCFGGVCKAFKYEWMHKTADNGKQRWVCGRRMCAHLGLLES